MRQHPDSAAAALRTAAPDGSRQFPVLGPRQRSALISWAGFTMSFAAVRAVTHAIKQGAGQNVDAGGVHLHHYLLGIALLTAAGGVGVHGSGRARLNPAVAAGYGAGAALVIDELALLVHFKEVYWAKSGRWSVIVALAFIAGTGASLALVPGLRRRRSVR